MCITESTVGELIMEVRQAILNRSMRNAFKPLSQWNNHDDVLRGCDRKSRVRDAGFEGP